MLPERCCVDVGIERHRHGQAALDQPAYVGVRPARLGGARDVAPCRRGELLVDGPERADPDRLDRPLALEEGHGASDRLCRRRRLDRLGSPDIVRPLTAHCHFDPPVSIPP
jgi:hypothetical protein